MQARSSASDPYDESRHSYSRGKYPCVHQSVRHNNSLPQLSAVNRVVQQQRKWHAQQQQETFLFREHV